MQEIQKMENNRNTINKERDFLNLQLMIEEMINYKNVFSHFAFYSWFHELFLDVVVYNYVKLNEIEFEMLHEIDNMLDYEVDFNLLPEEEKHSFSFSKMFLEKMYIIINNG